MKKLDNYKCIVTVIDGKLQKCDIKADGSPDMWAGTLNWQPVRKPVDQEFLDEANKTLGTSFKKEDFGK